MLYRLVIATILIPGFATAQNLDAVLTDIERNNLGLKANAQYWNAKNIEFKTGLTPYDPTVEFDYMIGTPVGAGNQRDFVATQRFDFPTTYIQKRQLANRQIEQAGWNREAYRKDILLEAKQTLVRLIYHNKRSAELNRRTEATRQLVQDYQKRLTAGEGTILDVNKAKLQLLSLQNDQKVNETDIKQLMVRLMELNGGIAVQVGDTTYPPTPGIPDFEILDEQIESNDPLIKVYQSNIGVGEERIDVQRALSLPKPEVGYHSQGILGQSYKGFHIGTSIPLWENKNRVKAEKANLTYSQLQLAAHRNEHRNENRRLYEQYLGRKEILDQYRSVIASINNEVLLQKALHLGQITIIEYFFELSYFYSAYDKYLSAEHEYHQAIAALLKYQL